MVSCYRASLYMRWNGFRLDHCTQMDRIDSIVASGGLFGSGWDSYKIAKLVLKDTTQVPAYPASDQRKAENRDRLRLIGSTHWGITIQRLKKPFSG